MHIRGVTPDFNNFYICYQDHCPKQYYGDFKPRSLFIKRFFQIMSIMYPIDENINE